MSLTKLVLIIGSVIAKGKIFNIHSIVDLWFEFVFVSQDVDIMTDRLYQEMRRYFYTTPSSYLDLLKLYLLLLDKKQQEIIRGRDRISCGLQVPCIPSLPI